MTMVTTTPYPQRKASTMASTTSTSQPCERRQRRHPRRSNDSTFFDALLSLALSLSPLGPTVVAGTTDQKVTGYYGPHSHRFRGLYGLSTPEHIDYKKLSRINYSSFQINEHGSIWGTDSNADPTLLFGPLDWNPPADAPTYCHQASPDLEPQCRHHYFEKGLIGGAHTNGAEVYGVIGGEEFSEEFSQIASDPDARTKFAENAASLLMNYEFDGLDIAWQFPQSAGNMTNYGVLLNEVRMALNKAGEDDERTFGLTATLPCDHKNLNNINIGHLDSVLSEFNLLSFDFYGPWDGKVGVNSPLYDPKVGRGHSINSCVGKYLEGGASRSKINIGLAFYGHSFNGAKNLEDECKLSWAGVCSDTSTWQADGGSPQYHNIYTEMPDLTLTFDVQTLTPLAYNDRGVVSFDDPRSICFKTEYAIVNELNGLIIMDLTGDTLEDKSTPLLDAINLKRLKNDIDCGGDEFQELFQWRDVGPSKKHIQIVAAENPEPIEEPVSTYRYMCGFGDGDAKDRCSSKDLEPISCDTGNCPEDMICFVVLCTKEWEDEVEVQEEPSSAASFAKSKPKRKPRPKPRSIVSETQAVSVSERKKKRPVPNLLTEDRSRGKMQFISDAGSVPRPIVPQMSFSCGIHFDHARLCGIPCPTGLSDCPSGQFCFWLECNSDPAPTEAPTGRPEMKYQCGKTRDDALTCPEDCGFAWQCPEGKDCYNVPCPT